MCRRNKGNITFHDPEGLPRVTAVEAVDIANRFPRHVHSSYIFSCIDRGRRKVKFTTGTTVFNAGEMCILPPGTSHSCESISGDAFGPHSYRALCVGCDLMDRITSHITGICNPPPGFDAAKPTTNFDRNSFEHFFSLLPVPGAGLEREASLNNFLSHAIMHLSNENYIPLETGPQQQSLERVRLYILKNFQDKITLASLASIGCISPYHLQKLFVKHYGISPQDMVISCRVRKAEQLLRQGRPLADAAIESGFSDQSHFSRQFKMLIGISPGHFVNDNIRH